MSNYDKFIIIAKSILCLLLIMMHYLMPHLDIWNEASQTWIIVVLVVSRLSPWIIVVFICVSFILCELCHLVWNITIIIKCWLE